MKTENFPIFFSWDLDSYAEKSIYDDWFKERKDISFYREDSLRLNLIQAKKIYSQLLKTSFLSLYSTSNHLEDFAESYAVYVHTVLMQKTYKLEFILTKIQYLIMNYLINLRGCKKRKHTSINYLNKSK